MSDNTFTLIVLALMMLTFVAIVYIMTKDYRNESIGTTWQGAIDELNEQIKERKSKTRKDRVDKNTPYYFIRMYIQKETENMSPLDDMNYMEGNYFYNFGEAHDTLEKIVNQLKNK